MAARPQMRNWSALVLLLAIAGKCQVSAQESAKPWKPIVTTDILSNTYDLLAEVSIAAYDAALKGPIDEHGPKVARKADELFELAAAKAGVSKKKVLSDINAAKDKLAVLKANVAEKVAIFHDTLNGKTNLLAAFVDGKAPRFAGLVPRTIGELLFSAAYCFFVLYILFRVALSVFRFWISLCCCCCCCGMCRKRQGAKGTSAAKAKAAPSSGAKAKNGKAKK